MTWKQLPSLALGNDFWETNAGEFPEVTATAEGCSDCWKLWQLLEAAATAGSCDGLPARPRMTENALSIQIVIFSTQLQQTETSERKLFISQHGISMCHSERYSNFYGLYI